MSVFALSQQQIRDAVAAEIESATAALEARVTALEQQLLDVVQPSTASADAAPKAARKPRGTTAGAQTASASGTSN